MSFPNENKPLPSVPTVSSNAATSKKVEPLSSPECQSTFTSVPRETMSPSRPPPNRIVDPQFEHNQNIVRPTTVDSAVEWINRHKPQIDQFFNLLEQYPQLVKSERIDNVRNPLPPIRRSVSESAAYPTTINVNQNHIYHRLDNQIRRKKHRSGDGGGVRNQGKLSVTAVSDRANETSNSVSSERYIYVCDVLTEQEDARRQASGSLSASALPSTREKIVTALSSYCFVRTGPDKLQSEAEFVEVIHTIVNADVFVILLSDRVLASGTCLHQLAVAAAYNVPIVPIREAGFKLGEHLVKELRDIEIIHLHYDEERPNESIYENETIRQNEVRTVTRDRPELHQSHSNGFQSESEGEDSKHASLAELLTDCYDESLLYVPNFHNSCISKLLGKLSEFLGEAYLDFEVSRQIDNGDETILINDRMKVPRIVNGTSIIEFPVINKGVLKSIRNSNKRGESTPHMPEKSDNLILPETPMSLDCSSGTPNSYTKLPPISKSPSAEQKQEVRNEADSMCISVDTSINPGDSHNIAHSSLLDFNQSDWDLTPDSSPFLETKYIVFPSDEPGFEKRRPFMVHFPQDIPIIDRRRSSASTDDYGFNHVKLDFEYDIVAPSPLGLSFFEEEEEPPKESPQPKKDNKPRAKKAPRPIQVKLRNHRPVREQQLVKMATISIKYGMSV